MASSVKSLQVRFQVSQVEANQVIAMLPIIARTPKSHLRKKDDDPQTECAPERVLSAFTALTAKADSLLSAQFLPRKWTRKAGRFQDRERSTQGAEMRVGSGRSAIVESSANNGRAHAPATRFAHTDEITPRHLRRRVMFLRVSLIHPRVGRTIHRLPLLCGR